MSFEERLYVAIGRQIRGRRQELGLTQDDLAGANHVGLTRTSITNIEFGQQRIQLHTLYAIADELEVSVCDLLPEIEVEEQKSVEELISDSSVIGREGKQELNSSERQLVLDLITGE